MDLREDQRHQRTAVVSLFLLHETALCPAGITGRPVAVARHLVVPPRQAQRDRVALHVVTNWRDLRGWSPGGRQTQGRVAPERERPRRAQIRPGLLGVLAQALLL